ncbi:hypothetical protein GO730_00565 [Spirosoma sp. HMF3257]|uniref:Uncharacterized protein n=1 Tax=Spirosoma telluris TaxID=2183553 RepID=A0A327NDW4_9BACT|nr:hypothetical protein [Spirosoma telluris]RAI73292.1 hypothetical protein HMF3257_00550 [Spirosoma telluris]
MKSLLLFGLFLIIPNLVLCQTDKIDDSFFVEVCNTLIDNQGRPDNLRIDEINKQHIIPLVKKYRKYEQQDMLYFIVARLQRNCPEYQQIMNRKYKSKGDFIQVDKKPTSILDKEACKSFLERGKYYYYEDDGEIAQLTLDKGFWEDHFKDGTYSKLKLSWIGDCEFEIEFIESNNKLRKNISRPGDKYRYQILSKDNSSYILSLEIPGNNEFHTFKLYY